MEPKAPLLKKEDLVAAISKHFEEQFSVNDTNVISRFLRLKKEERFDAREGDKRSDGYYPQ